VKIGSSYSKVLIKESQPNIFDIPSIETNRKLLNTLPNKNIILNIEKLFQYEINIISTVHDIKNSNDQYVFVCISNKHKYFSKDYEFFHFRKASKKLINSPQNDLIQNLENWIKDKSYSIELLSNNIDKLTAK
jgi:hypothetical protein